MNGMGQRISSPDASPGPCELGFFRRRIPRKLIVISTNPAGGHRRLPETSLNTGSPPQSRKTRENRFFRATFENIGRLAAPYRARNSSRAIRDRGNFRGRFRPPRLFRGGSIFNGPAAIRSSLTTSDYLAFSMICLASFRYSFAASSVEFKMLWASSTAFFLSP